MTSKYSLTVIMVIAGMCSGCMGSTQASQDKSDRAITSSKEANDMTEKTQTLSGTLVYKTHEGGFFGFVTDEGKHYTLRNLDNAYRLNGIHLVVKGHAVSDVMTFTQFGTMFNIQEVLDVDKSGVNPVNKNM